MRWMHIAAMLRRFVSDVVGEQPFEPLLLSQIVLGASSEVEYLALYAVAVPTDHVAYVSVAMIVVKDWLFALATHNTVAQWATPPLLL